MTILEKRIDGIFWSMVVLNMTHINNLRPTQAFERSISLALIQNKNFHNKNLLNFHHLHVFSLIVYILFYKEKCILKSAMWDTKALKKKLVEYNENTIYRVYIEDHNKIIRIKDLWIFKDTLTKTFSILPNFDRKSMFDTTQIPDEQNSSNKNSSSENKKTKSRSF